MHSFLGRSTGRGALGIWTHNLNSIEPRLNYSSPAYTGAAIRLGAGVQSAAAYAVAHRLGYRVVGGTCPTVGIAGGYSLGGGHSMLTPLHGLGADNVLEWEVVTADGTHTVASPRHHADLYWALSGGGGGTYAVVVAMTARMHRDDGPTHGARLFFNASSSSSSSLSPAAANDVFWGAVDIVQAEMAPIADSGASLSAVVFGGVLTLTLTAPGQPAQQVRGHLQRLLDHFGRHNASYWLDETAHASYFEHFNYTYGPLPDGPPLPAGLVTGRLLPRSVAASATARAALTRLVRDTVTADPGFVALLLGLRTPAPGAPGAPVAANAVHPAWRDAIGLVNIAALWDYAAPPAVLAARQQRLTHVVDPALVALMPGSAPYLNEANYAMPDLLRQSYGPNLERLRQVKQRYDPEDIFWAAAAVGREAWAPDAEGRLCRP